MYLNSTRSLSLLVPSYPPNTNIESLFTQATWQNRWFGALPNACTFEAEIQQHTARTPHTTTKSTQKKRGGESVKQAREGGEGRAGVSHTNNKSGETCCGDGVSPKGQTTNLLVKLQFKKYIMGVGDNLFRTELICTDF